MKKFDLNIESILEDWEIYHAIREIIANALDEQLLTNSRKVDIYQDQGYWIVRDYGRGLEHMHLTQNENQEKLDNPNVIGRFGIGLKDALATFDRHDIGVEIKSRHGNITILKHQKQGFSDIITLHAVISEPEDSAFIGTEFKLSGVTEYDIEKAKNLFLCFSQEPILETTKQGQIVQNTAGCGNIYINGVKVADEPNFMFSYNITVMTAAIKRALNRERSNVGRTAYTDSVKRILLSSESETIANMLSRDLININRGTARDELSWIDVQEHAVKLLNKVGDKLFVTSYEAMFHTDLIDQANKANYEVIVVPDNLRQRLHESRDHEGGAIVDITQFTTDYNESFDFDFIRTKDMTSTELNVYNHTRNILDLIGGLPYQVDSIRISNTVRKDLLAPSETLGCWDESNKCIVISRKTLSSLDLYAGTLIHELIHAKTGYGDVSREFETALTKTIGKITKHYLDKQPSRKKKKSFWF